MHFKSTDGHRNVYNFSLKRLNLTFLDTISNASHQDGAVLLVDASKYKIQPDSLSATVPIWCTVMNRLVVYYRNQLSFMDQTPCWNDTSMALFTPPGISQERHEQIEHIIGERVKSTIDAKVIMDPKSFLESAPVKPMRCFWIQNDDSQQSHNLNQLYSEINEAKHRFSCIVCISCSDVLREKSDAQYISGAADDEESWSNGLTPSLFWENIDSIIHETTSEEETDEVITSIVVQAKIADEEWFRAESSRSALRSDPKIRPSFTSYFDRIGLPSETKDGSITIGTRRSGRPPECWEYFDAVVNVTTMEYEEMSSAEETLPDGKFYLQLPVKEGKRDKSELENWMAVAMLFIGVNLKKKRRILIHCAQGMDRSVAITMASLCLYYDFLGGIDTTSLSLHSWCKEKMSYTSFQAYVNNLNVKAAHGSDINEEMESTHDETYLRSGIPLELANTCKGKKGRDIFLSYLRSLSSNREDGKSYRDEEVFATKDTLRLALIKIQQYRIKSCPTRSTMQKLNRFFMSSVYEK